LIEEKATFSSNVQSHLDQSNINGACFSLTDDPVELGAELKRQLGPSGILIFLPGLAAVAKGTTNHIPADQLLKLTSFGIPVLPLSIHIPSESSPSTEKPVPLPSFIFSFGELIEPTHSSPARFFQSLLEAEERAFSSREFLKGSLPIALLSRLKKYANATIYDGTSDDVLPYGKILGTAIALSKELKKLTQKKRVGIILPPGKGGLIANLAVFFAGKIPVNLNFTAADASFKSACRQADIDRFITADPFVRKLPNFPWPPNRDLIFIERLLPDIKKKIIKWVILAKLLPVSTLCKLLHLGESRGDDEALLLFTSGSSGEPKGVPLSHRNLLANVTQFSSKLELNHNHKVFGSLPLFHSFGITATLLYPCIQGISLVTYPSPLETKRIAELIAQEKVHLLLSTPTFLRGYMRKIDPAQLSSLLYIITGAEKLPEKLARIFEKKFSHLPMEGYGLTETSPATNVNIPNAPEQDGLPIIPTEKFGTVGHLLPGIAIRFTDPVTDQPVDLDQAGIVHFKGANVFTGYLGKDKEELNKKILSEDGWFTTGDVGRLDKNGFLSIEGRISRFSKIGGEMVPHEVVEAAVNTALGLDESAERKTTIVGIPDEQKGEAIILLSSLPVAEDLSIQQQTVDLRYKLMDAGLPSLWCPKTIKPVHEIPVLASGKLDIKAAEKLALE